MQAKTKTLKPLVMTTGEEEKLKFEFVTKDHLSKEDVKVTQTMYDEYQEGSRQNRFDYVVALLFNDEVTADDVEMMEEYYQHYAKAPVFVWVSFKVAEELAGLKKFLKTTVPHSEHILYESNDDAGKAAAIKQAYALAQNKYNELKTTKVEPLFKKYDKDNSGAIDKGELASLCKDLGVPLDDAQLNAAIADLDVNNDGVIDLSEFSKWWFSGFQSYDTYRRNMLKLKTKGKNALETFQKGNVGEWLTGPLSTKKHNMKVGFNTPQNAGFQFSAAIYPGGKTTNNLSSDLEGKFADASLLDRAKVAAADP